MLSAAEVSSFIRQSGANAHRWVGGLYTPSDGRAEPWQAVPTVAELARKEGVIVRENCAVRALDIQGGKVGF